MEKFIINQISTNGIGYITLNRPERHNAFNSQMIAELTFCLQDFDQHPDVRVIVLSAMGKNFCAGADLEWMQQMSQVSFEENLADAQQLMQLLKTLTHLKKPTVAIPKGICAGGGVGLLCCCDIVIASQNTICSFTETKLGLVPATIAPYVVQAIGLRNATYLFLTAKKITSNEAHQLGIVHEIIADEELTVATDNLISHLLHCGPIAQQTSKELVRQVVHYNDQTLHETAVLLAKIRTSDEAKEGLAAFLEKRLPAWENHDLI